MKLQVELDVSEVTRADVEAFLAETQARADLFSTHGALNLGSLLEMLLEDVALMVSRPGSWEGANMGNVMASHGY
ncbi:hypothetical protein ABIF63_000035 [Bradyrhizobium japonicum]|uniref:Uncharacterized protein n=1 Tax=Bradyrhizobium japonicum TaxID=375 RepID=A0ABV2RI26_BRAJP